ncbi:MAG: hypothetical protein IJ557_05835 [Bacteroidaceae bacterium]|nr:hypothetical protein [Bacteroidaceae bacterium]
MKRIVIIDGGPRKMFNTALTNAYYTYSPYNYPDNLSSASTAFNTHGRYAALARSPLHSPPTTHPCVSVSVSRTP